jgi:hypothetical protein
VVVQVNVLTTGIFSLLAKDAATKAKLGHTLVNFKNKAVEIKRTYTFKPDRVAMNDELLWIYPDMEIKDIDIMPAFVPGCVQGPARLVKDGMKVNFYQTGSDGDKLPKGITFPFTAENFLKNGYKVSMRTTAASFDLGKANMYFYERAWQQDWYQTSGFTFGNLTDSPAGKPITMANEVVFSKADVSEMPPIVTIQSPPWDARDMDQPGEVAPYKIGETFKLIASAVNSDGSPVPDKDISWEIRINQWWHTPPVTLEGNNILYKIPEVVNEEDKKMAVKKLQAIIKVKAKGKNGTESVETFAMLVGKASP